jgi:hypothetical protein
VEKCLKRAAKDLDARGKMFPVHGNRLIAHIVFNRLAPDIKTIHVDLTNTDVEQIENLADSTITQLIAAANELYPDAYLASLFKNPGKCKQLG